MTQTRQPLDRDRCAAWVRSQRLFTDIRVVEQTGSTNADLLAAAADGAADGSVLVAERQTAGRGRLDRTWQAPPYAGLTFSFLLRPTVSTTAWGWLPLLVGLGVYDAVVARGVDAALKWPNDLQVGPDREKAGGILAQATTGERPAVVVGIGLNVHADADELPDGAAALSPSGTTMDRTDLLVGLLGSIASRYRTWVEGSGDAGATGLRAAYVQACATVGQDVAVSLPGTATPLRGRAVAVDGEGRLLVDTGGAVRAIGAGDVVHVRRLGPTP